MPAAYSQMVQTEKQYVYAYVYMYYVQKEGKGRAEEREEREQDKATVNVWGRWVKDRGEFFTTLVISL